MSGITPDWINDEVPEAAHETCYSATEVEEKKSFGGPYHLNPAMYDEYAEMVVSMLLYARHQAGVDFEYFSPINESDCFPREGPRVDPGEMPALLRAVAGWMEKEGLVTVKLVVAEAATKADYASAILADEVLMRQVAVVGQHTYGDAKEFAAESGKRSGSLGRQRQPW